MIQAQVFERQEAPYGIPFISFPSFEGDSTIFVAPGHSLDKRRLLATYSFIMRQYMYTPMLSLAPEEYLREGWAKYRETPGVSGSFKITIERDEDMTDQSYAACTYMEF